LVVYFAVLGWVGAVQWSVLDWLMAKVANLRFAGQKCRKIYDFAAFLPPFDGLPPECEISDFADQTSLALRVSEYFDQKVC